MFRGGPEVVIFTVIYESYMGGRASRPRQSTLVGTYPTTI